MNIGGFIKTSLIDYPEKVASVVFTQGCNFRCGYCHNPKLVRQHALPDNAAANRTARGSSGSGNFKGTLKFPDGEVPPNKNQTPLLNEQEILDFLKKRFPKIDGVVITGGEPTLQPDLLNFIGKLKEIGLLVKLDTNGSNPKVIKKALQKNLLDYIAMDIKGPFSKYKELTGHKSTAPIKESVRIIISSGIEYEFRTTVTKEILTPRDLIETARQIKGASKYILQKFRPQKTLDPAFGKMHTYSDQEFTAIIPRLTVFVRTCMVR